MVPGMVESVDEVRVSFLPEMSFKGRSGKSPSSSSAEDILEFFSSKNIFENF